MIDATAKLGNNVSIGANAVIESGVELGDNVIIGAGCFVGKNSKIGAGSRLWANVTIYHEIQIGQNCLIQSGTVVGADGFGYANDRGNWVKIPQIGRVIIGDRVEIGACTTIDRGALDDTIIGNGVIIDNQCQIAHNVVIGDNTAVASGRSYRQPENWSLLHDRRSQRNQRAYGNMRQSDGYGHGYGDASHH